MKPEPLTPADCDLRDCSWMPLDVVRLRDSDLVVLASGDAFRAAVMLWCAAWHQVPAASLPKDDRLLANLAGFGRDLKSWEAVKDDALRGFIECDDGRLYHPVVAEKAIEAKEQRQKQKERTKAAANARRNGNRDDNRHDQRDDQQSGQRDDDRNDSRDDHRHEVQQTLPDSTFKKERESPAIGEKPTPPAPDSLSKPSQTILKKAGLESLGTNLPEKWIPDEDLCADVKRDFGMTDDDIRTELTEFHRHHAAAGSFSANWRASFGTWCKRWREHRDKQAPPRVQVSNAAPKRPEEFTEAEWDKVAAFYAKTGRWQRGAGSDPMSPACRCPKTILERHNIDLETGEWRPPPRKAASA